MHVLSARDEIKVSVWVYFMITMKYYNGEEEVDLLGIGK